MKSRRTLTYFHSGSELMRARAPHAVAAPLEEAQRVDALGVEHVLARLVDVDLEPRQAADDLVRRRLVHAALDVAARVDAGDEAGRRQQQPPRRRALRRRAASDRGSRSTGGRAPRTCCRTGRGSARISVIELFAAAVDDRDAVAQLLGMGDQTVRRHERSSTSSS